jgi:short-subunit dehydrogenase
VVTGATSGIGRATALAFARHGARLALVARDADRLADLAGECRQQGGEALVVPADVADPAAVARVRAEAVRRFGRVDVWVNGASVGIAARFGDEPVDEVRRLVDTNILGCVNGSRTALEQFRAQGGGTLVNVSSLLGLAPNPLVSTYVMSKFAVRGLTLSLQEGPGREPGIHVCCVLPGPVDTPFFERAGNHTGLRLRAIAPAAAPERLAAKIVSCARARRPRREVTVGLTGHALHAGHRLAPRTTERLVARASARLIVRKDELVPDTSGALFDPQPDLARVHGPWRVGRTRRRLGEQVGRALARWA